MFLALIPLFDEEMAVRAYSIFSQKDNFFLNPLRLGTGQNDGAALVEGLELIESMGIETLSEDKEIFVPLGNISIFSDVESQCSAPHNRIVFLIDYTIPPVEIYVKRLRELKEKGYKLAVQKLPVEDYERWQEILKLADYIFLNNKKTLIGKGRQYFAKRYPGIKVCAGGIDDMPTFEFLRDTGKYPLYEGEFYRVPVTRGSHQVAPLKANYIELLNVVNKENYELTEAAKIISRDPALTISLLKMVNRMTVKSGITTIRHAAAMLGQKELKRWITTAAVNELSADRPSEITRLSLLRAKFAENLAPVFGRKEKSEELFLMGLFSVLDVILEKPMAEALEIVMVTGDVRSALLDGTGCLAPVYDMMKQYERANWQEVSRQLLLAEMDAEKVCQAYVDALSWYKNLTA
ncbi:MAG: HDOD domain-containing protein [Roseburia sp.]|nr:HDOD domain-containing protein [Roseburia sp.]MCM1099411.1 HDOD domain-containing protein [Ruminococcus flavefaciens]